jgi:hypothetical protein
MPANPKAATNERDPRRNRHPGNLAVVAASLRSTLLAFSHSAPRA